MKCPKCGEHMKYEKIEGKNKKHYWRYRCTNIDCKHIFKPEKKGQKRLM